MARLSFLLWAFRSRWRRENNTCPYCKSVYHQTLGRKFVLCEVRKCNFCGLFFRWPSNSAEEARAYYEDQYNDSAVTALPEPSVLEQYKKIGFKGTPFEQQWYLYWMKQTAEPPARVLDFGASWGYISYQFKHEGYQVEGFELSKSRARFGESHLGIKLHNNWEQVKSAGVNRFDVIFAGHSLEHVYDLRETLDAFYEVAKPGAKLLVIVPNGGSESARKGALVHTIGETHTIAFTGKWFDDYLEDHGWKPLRICSSFSGGNVSDTTDGDGLICIAERMQERRVSS